MASQEKEWGWARRYKALEAGLQSPNHLKTPGPTENSHECQLGWETLLEEVWRPLKYLQGVKANKTSFGVTESDGGPKSDNLRYEGHQQATLGHMEVFGIAVIKWMNKII